ncbi:MAG: RNA-guided endonuclease TnpB family protein [Methylophilaceae bacterium]
MRRVAGACRYVYNKALAWQKEQYAADKAIKFSYTKLAYLLPDWKLDPASTWLKESPSQTLQQALKNLETSYLNFFTKLADFPRFKKRGQHDSFRFPQGFKLEQGNNRVFLPKLGWIRYRNSRDVLGDVKNITVSQCNGKWYASIQTEREVDAPTHVSTSALGVDVGITQFASLSTGEIFAPVNSFRGKQARLARYQRAMSRRVKFSNNWKKTKARITKLHQRVAHIRNDFLHKTSTTISKNHAIIVIEDLKVTNMSKSASGTIEVPGRNVKAKSGLNKSILDQGWGEFRRQLEYKQAWRGGEVLAVPPQYTSQRCSCCGHVANDNRTTQAKFACVSCGHSLNADLNAARNILAAGHAVLACGEMMQLGHSVKQAHPEGKSSALSESVGIPVL